LDYQFVSATITQNLIYGNSSGSGSASGLGAGVYFSIPDTSLGVTLVSNTIVNNTLTTTAGQGSAVWVSGFASRSQVFNNLLIGYPGQGAVYCESSVGIPTLMNNYAYATNGTGFGGTCAGLAGQNGNISADPLFSNPAVGDFHVQANSPVVDAGTNAAPNLLQTDFAGNPRILDSNNDCVSAVDMGAYELIRSASVSFSASTLNFGNQALNTSSSPRSVTLSNTGSGCFQFSGIGITGDFSQSNNCGATGVRGGTSCNFNVAFTPTALGTRLGALTVGGSDGITSASPTVNLNGVGVDFSITATPSSASVKHGQSVKIQRHSQSVRRKFHFRRGVVLLRVAQQGLVRLFASKRDTGREWCSVSYDGIHHRQHSAR
jgi:hypothetical protein